jgi:flagellar biogenesis protein FliO
MVMAASGVDWSQIVAVRLLGVALMVLFLLWAIRRMFGKRK